MTPQNNDETLVRKALADMAKAYERRDMAGMRASFSSADDVSMIGTGRDEHRRGAAAMEAQFARDWAQTDAIAIRLGNPTVSTQGHQAWAWAEGNFEIRAGGQDMRMPARASFVLRKEDGAWRIAHAHFSTPAAGQEDGSSIPG